MYRYFFAAAFSLFINSGKAQTALDTLRFVDFHIHTAMKNYYRSVPHPDSLYSSIFLQKIKGINWEDSSEKNVKDKTGFSGVLGRSAYNQATFNVLDNSPASFLCTSSYSVEKQSSQDTAIKIKIGLGGKILVTLGALLGNRDAKFILKKKYAPSIIEVNENLVLQMSRKRLELYQDDNFTNFSDLKAHIKFISDQVAHPSATSKRPIFFVRDSQQLDSLTKNHFIIRPIFLFSTIEGGHNFYGKFSSSLTYPRLNSIKDYRFDDSCKEEIFRNINEIKNSDHHLFFVTISHLFWNKMAGFARGLDVDVDLFRKALAKAMWDKEFSNVDLKWEQGIIDTIRFLNTDSLSSNCRPVYIKSRINSMRDSIYNTEEFGYRVIDSLLSGDNIYRRRTYIDLRHADILTRINYIDYLREKYPNSGIPIIISHAAVSGKDRKLASVLGLSPFFDDYKEFINPKKFYYYYFLDRNPKYKNGECWRQLLNINNKNDVNRSLDKSGWFHPMSNNLFDEEIKAVYKSDGIIGITMEERALGKGAYNYRHASKSEQIGKFFQKNNTTLYYFTNYKSDKKGHLDSLKIAEPFIRNLFYIVENSGEYGNLESWKHIAIGSDFDGIMNPIDICPTAADIPGFYWFLVNNLEFYADYLKKDKAKLFVGKTPAELLNMVFYQNGERFIKKYF